MVKEDRQHRSHKLNPRRWPTGPEDYPNASRERIWRKLRRGMLLSMSEAQFLQDVPRCLKDGNYANLGHGRGGSAILLSSGLREHRLQGKVYSVDLKYEERAEALMNKLDVHNYIEKCEGSTDYWFKQFKDRNLTFNFVFIDADHCYEAVVKDFSNWSLLVRVGGWISFHDTNQDFSHKAIEDTVEQDDNWKERENLHIHRIRTFERVR